MRSPSKAVTAAAHHHRRVARRYQRVLGVYRTMQGSGRVFRHYKGGLYTVLHLAAESTNRRQSTRGVQNYTVVYVSLKTGRIHTRDMMEFVQVVRYRGRQVQRFAPVSL